MPNNRPEPADSLELVRAVDALCDRFEDAWQRGERPDLDAWLPTEELLRKAALPELARLDLESRLSTGEEVRAEHYLARYPALRAKSETAKRLLAAEYAGRGIVELAPPEAGTLAPSEDPAPEALTLPRVPLTDAAPPDIDEYRTLDTLGTLPPLPLHRECQATAEGWQTVPGYAVLGVLGQGGMGVVYKARQLGLNRVVALKMILHAEHAGPEARRRFRAEAEAVARLQHANIVQIHEVGEHKGLPYFSLEFCAGGSLADKLDGTPLPPAEAARLIETLAQAMQAAHQAGVVHRDLKPANVLLAEDGTPKVTDFGLAKKMDAAGQTNTGAIMGTPSYMAPEQAGGSKDIGPAADVYALGAILYELLTGRPPFKAATLLDTLREVVNVEPVAPRQLHSRTPKDLETICLKCLQKEPAKRYAHAAALAEDLRRFLESEPVEARPVGALERGWRWCRRYPAVAASLLVVALALAGGAVVSTAFALHAEQARRDEAAHASSEARAKQEAEEARSEAQRQLIDLSGASGVTASKEQDHSLALLWFARAAQLATGEPRQEELNRIRIANWLRHVCLPEATFTIPGFQQLKDRFRTFEFSSDGRYLLVVASTGDCLVWDRQQARLVPLPRAAAKGLAAAWHPRSGVLAVAEKEGPIRFLAPPEFHPVGEVTPTGAITVLAFSRDGIRLAWGGSDGARVWDQDKKEYVTRLLAHGETVDSLSFSAGGNLLATSARDSKARVFRIALDRADPLFPPVEQRLNVNLLSDSLSTGREGIAPRFAGDDGVLVTAVHDRLNWRSTTTGQILMSVDTPFLSAFAVNPEGTHVAAFWLGGGGLWDARSRKFLAAIPQPHISCCEDVRFTADGKTLVSADRNGTVHFWSVDNPRNNTLSASSPFVSHPMQVAGNTLSADGRHLAAALWDGRICLWRMPEGPPVAHTMAGGWPTLPAVSTDRRFVLPRSTSFRSATQREVRVYEAESGKAAGPILDPGGILIDAAFSPDGTRVASASLTAQTPKERNERLFEPEGKAGSIQFWDWKSGQRIAGPIPMPSEPRGLAYRPDGRILAVVCADYHILLLDPKVGKITHELDPGARSRPANANLWWANGDARFSPDGRFLVTWEVAPAVHVWHPDRGQLLHTLPHHQRVQHVSFSPTTPELLATAGRDRFARIWNLETGKLLAQLLHPHLVIRLRFSSDGMELITSCDDGQLRVWDWRTGKLKVALPLHSILLQDFDFTADRRWLVTLGGSELQVTDWPSRTPAGPLWNLPEYIHLALAVSAGDRRAIVGGFSAALVGYDLEKMTTPSTAPAQALVELAELAAGRRILSQGNVVPLTSAEWAERWRRLQRGGHPLLPPVRHGDEH